MAIHAYAYLPAQPLAADGAALIRVLGGGGVSKDSLVRITGSAGATPAVLKPLDSVVEQQLREMGRTVQIARRRGFGFKTAA